MALLSLREVRIAFGSDPLLDNVSLHIERGDRACLVGRNGCGKSTLLKLLAGQMAPDAGTVSLAAGVRTAYLPQEVPESTDGTVLDIVEHGDAHQNLTDAWTRENAARQMIQRMALDPSARFMSLSGGMKRRTLLARVLFADPDVLLLDEPTNHLDIDAIEWLESFLLRPGRTLLFVTHDRRFLRKLSTRILDLDRGLLAGWDCDYDTFLGRKQQLLADETAVWEKRDKKLSQEEIWIRKGIKARRTRNEGRVRTLLALREQFNQRRPTPGVSRVKIQEAEASGSLVIKAEKVGFSYPGEAPLIHHLDLRIQRGERIGIIGPNGAGKTTLLKLITGEIQPQSGRMIRGTRLETAYFDQLRMVLDGEKSIVENVAGDHDFVMIDGQKRHIYGYLQDFMFTPERARTPVKALSGGERNRLMLAMLLLRPCNLLIMDEPTNDLDMETLELLEEQLQQNAQTLLLVSHDRDFLNNVVTRTLVFEGSGRIRSYAGGYDDWVARRPPRQPDAGPEKPVTTSPPSVAPLRRLTFSERHEHQDLIPRIDALETEQTQWLKIQCAPDFYQKPVAEQATIRARAETIAHEIERLLERWTELESRFNGD